MNAKAQASIIVHLPGLHPDLVAMPVPDAVRFLNPGIEASGERWYVPDTLPLDRKQAKRSLNAFLELGRQYEPGQLSTYALLAEEQGDPQSDLGLAETAGLTHFLAGQGLTPAAAGIPGSDQAPRIDPLVRSQQILLLAWSMEERALEMRSLTSAYDSAQRALDQALADDGGEGDFISPETGDEESPLPPWRLVVANMASFLSEDAALLTTEQELRDVWEARGVVFEPLTPADAGVLGLGQDEARAWRRAEMDAKDLTDGGGDSPRPEFRAVVYAPA